MNKKDIDFGLKDIKIDDYKLKKNNSGKLISIIILIVVTIFYYKYSSFSLTNKEISKFTKNQDFKNCIKNQL